MTEMQTTKPVTMTIRKTSFAVAAGIVWGLCGPVQAQKQAPTMAPAPVPSQVESQAEPQVQPPVAEATPPAPGAGPEAVAQQPAPPVTPPRYTFNRVDDGFLRLDSETGQVAVCSQHTVGWACQAVPEDRAALEREIARLQDAVAGLKTEIAALRAPPPPTQSSRQPPRPPAELTPRPDENGMADTGKPAIDNPAIDKPARDKPVIAMPTHEDIERARAAVENAWRRLVDMIVGFKNDVLRKG